METTTADDARILDRTLRGLRDPDGYGPTPYECRLLVAHLDGLVEALETARLYVSSEWWNCSGGIVSHEAIEADLDAIDAALGVPHTTLPNGEPIPA